MAIKPQTRLLSHQIRLASYQTRLSSQNNLYFSSRQMVPQSTQTWQSTDSNPDKQVIEGGNHAQSKQSTRRPTRMGWPTCSWQVLPAVLTLPVTFSIKCNCGKV